MELRHIEVVDGMLTVRVEGEGPEMVLLHGGDAGTWNGLWAALTARHRCFALDLRGFGASHHRGKDRFSHVADVTAAMDALAVPEAVLVGVSQGGTIAIDVALAHPGRVRSMALISPGLSGWRWSEEWRRRWREIVGFARTDDMDRARELWWAHPLFDSLRGTQAGAAFEQDIRRYSGREWIMDHQTAEASAIDRLDQIGVPVKLLRGGRDVTDFAGIADYIASHVPDCRAAARSDLGHLLHLEDPDWVLRELCCVW
jgi:pimeloyl-ACP methyl ester carboxylesterase